MYKYFCVRLSEVYMTNEKFKNLKRIVQKEVSFTEEDILNQSTKIAVLYQKYLSIYTTVLATYNTIKIDLDEMFGILYRKYRIEDDVDWKNANAITSQIKCDPKYCTLLRECNRLEIILKFLEKTLSNIKDISHNMRNYLEAKKLLTGRDY